MLILFIDSAICFQKAKKEAVNKTKPPMFNMYLFLSSAS